MLFTKRTLLPVFLGILVPGLGHLFKGNKWSFLFFQAVILVGIVTLCWSRFILQPLGLFSLVAFITITHFTSSLLAPYSTSQTIKSKKLHWGAFAILPSFFLILSFSLYYFRGDWLGFGIYNISSHSMAPTLQRGDFIVADTWAYKEALASPNDIVLFTKNTFDKRTLVKRIHERRPSSNSATIEYYVIGDNQAASSDSRYFGWIKQENLQGKVISILLSHTEKGYHFKRFGHISTMEVPLLLSTH